MIQLEIRRMLPVLWGMAALMTGCDRMKMSGTSVTFKAPERGVLSLPDPGPDKKLCFAVDVLGSGINESEATSCAPKLGTMSAFVDYGQDITVEVLAGSSRQIDLFAYLANADESCPSFDSSFSTQGARFGRTYKVGSVTGVDVSGSEVVVSMPILPFKLNRSVMTEANLLSCDSPAGPRLLTQLTSGGDLLESSGQSRLVSFVTAIWETVSQWLPSGDSAGLSGVTNGADLVSSEREIAAPPFLRSLVRKPDSLDYFALIGEGEIVRYVPSTGQIVPLTTETCPFAAESCRVPAWVQGISPGYGDNLYVLDHGGQIYRQSATEELVSVGAVTANISHVVYY